jgi:hypothetical protein
LVVGGLGVGGLGVRGLGVEWVSSEKPAVRQLAGVFEVDTVVRDSPAGALLVLDYPPKPFRFAFFHARWSHKGLASSRDHFFSSPGLKPTAGSNLPWKPLAANRSRPRYRVRMASQKRSPHPPCPLPRPLPAHQVPLDGLVQLAQVHSPPLDFWYFWLTIQNTANWHVSNAFDLLSVFISFSWRLGGTQSLAVRPKTAGSSKVPSNQLRALLRVEKNPFDGGKNFFRRGYIDLRMHEEGIRVD